MTRTMYLVKKREYRCWTHDAETARIARRIYPELKGGRITNVLQMFPLLIRAGVLYNGSDIIKPETK